MLSVAARVCVEPRNNCSLTADCVAASFSPRYSLVMFRDDVPYAEAQRRGRIQQDILDSITAGIDDPGAVDYERAGRLIAEQLEPLPSHAG